VAGLIRPATLDFLSLLTGGMEELLRAVEPAPVLLVVLVAAGGASAFFLGSLLGRVALLGLVSEDSDESSSESPESSSKSELDDVFFGLGGGFSLGGLWRNGFNRSSRGGRLLRGRLGFNDG